MLLSITFVVLQALKKINKSIFTLVILIIFCGFSKLSWAQSALEKSLEKDIPQRYSTPWKLIEKYNKVLQQKQYRSANDQAIIKVYLATCYRTIGNNEKFATVKENAFFPFDSKTNPLASCRSDLLKFLLYPKKGDADSLKAIMNHCIQIAASIKQPQILAEAYNKLGLSEQDKGQYDSASVYFNKSIQTAQQHNNLPELALVQNHLAYIEHIFNGDLNKAIALCQQSISIGKKNNFDVISATSSRGIADYFKAQRQRDSSIYYLKNAIRLNKKLKNYREIIICYISLANTFVEVDNLKAATSFLQQAEELCFKHQHENLLPYIYTNQSSTIPKDSTAQRIALAQKCIKISKEQNNYLVLLNTTMNLGSCYKEANEYLKAKEAFAEAKKYVRSSQSKELANILNRYFIDFHNSWKKDKPEEFKQYATPINYDKVLSETEKFFYSNSNTTELEAIYKTTIAYYKGKNLSKVADYQERLLALKDSTYSMNEAEANSNYLEELRNEKKEKAMLKLKADHAISELQNKQLLLGSALALILLSLLGYYIYKQIQKRNAEEQKERALAIRHKLSNDLHDEVGSNLTGLVLMAEGISMSDNPSKTSIDKLATLSRSTMSTMRDTVWAIDSRKDAVGDLVARMIDFGQDLFEDSETLFKIKQEIENDKKLLVTEIRQNIYLLYKEALSNAAKHSKGDQLNVFIKQSDKSFELKVYNNRDADKKIKASGLGLESMRERAEAFGGTFTIDTQDGFTVRAIFPL